MPTYVSPGVYVVEKDISDYPASVNSSVVGIVGFADRGPVAGKDGKKATLITGPQALVDLFGEPSEAIKGQALEGALEILETTNSLYFVRCADDTAVEASAIVSIGSCPAIRLPGAADLGFSPGATDAGTSGITITVSSTTVDNDGAAPFASNKVFTINKSNTSLAAASDNYEVGLAYKKAIGGDLASADVGVFYDAGDDFAYLVLNAPGANAVLTASIDIFDPDNTATVSGTAPHLDLIDADGAAGGSPAKIISASGVTVSSADVGYLVQSIYPGAGYNLGTKSNGDTSGASFEVNNRGGKDFGIDVNDGGAAAEGFLGSFVSGASYIEETVGTSVAKATSQLIIGSFVSGATYGDLDADDGLASFTAQLTSLGTLGTVRGKYNGAADADVDPRFVKLIKGTYGLAGGNSGIPTAESDVATAVIGQVETDGGRTGIEALDDDLLNISLALVPGEGVGDIASIQNALITKAETTKNFLAVLSPKYNIGKLQDAIDWSNGLSETRTAAINSSYAALYWPWLKVFSVFDGKDRWYDPAIFAVRQMTYTDSVSDPWFAPAGFVRGRLTKPLETEVVLNQGDRDTMYSGGNVLNPMVNFPQRGIAVWGQRTAQRDPSALDRINVRRLMIYLRKVILASTQRLVFEPNDRFTWARVEGLVNPLLDDIARRRGITEFKVVCDETTNTPLRVDRNEMWVKVLIKPTKTAEMVIFELNLTSQSANLGSL